MSDEIEAFARQLRGRVVGPPLRAWVRLLERFEAWRQARIERAAWRRVLGVK